MPIKVSAKKRLKVSARRRLENLARTRAYKDAIKAFKKAVSSKDRKAGEKLSRAIAVIDKAAKTHVIHKNKAGRLKSKIMKLASEKKIQPVSAKLAPQSPKGGVGEKVEAPKKVKSPAKRGQPKAEKKVEKKPTKKVEKPAKK